MPEMPAKITPAAVLMFVVTFIVGTYLKDQITLAGSSSSSVARIDANARRLDELDAAVKRCITREEYVTGQTALDKRLDAMQTDLRDIKTELLTRRK